MLSNGCELSRNGFPGSGCAFQLMASDDDQTGHGTIICAFGGGGFRFFSPVVGFRHQLPEWFRQAISEASLRRRGHGSPQTQITLSRPYPDQLNQLNRGLPPHLEDLLVRSLAILRLLR